MQYDVETPEEYMNCLEPGWKLDKLEELRQIIKAGVPSVEEGIGYKMLSYAYKGQVLFHLNAQKAFVGFYVGDAKLLDPSGELLKGIDKGKSCVRFKKSTEVVEENIQKIIQAAVIMSDNGKGSQC